jgi:hypothetical protein
MKKYKTFTEIMINYENSYQGTKNRIIYENFLKFNKKENNKRSKVCLDILSSLLNGKKVN